jgi:hypothetical protein
MLKLYPAPKFRRGGPNHRSWVSTEISCAPCRQFQIKEPRFVIQPLQTKWVTTMTLRSPNSPCTTSKELNKWTTSNRTRVNTVGVPAESRATGTGKGSLLQIYAIQSLEMLRRLQSSLEPNLRRPQRVGNHSYIRWPCPRDRRLETVHASPIREACRAIDPSSQHRRIDTSRTSAPTHLLPHGIATG